MNFSQYDDLAKKINPKNPLNQERPTEAGTMSPNDYWKANVQNKEDAEKFFKIFYPALPDVVCKAMAYHFNDCVEGKVEIDKKWLMMSDRQKVAEELQKEIEEQRAIGLANLKNKQS